MDFKELSITQRAAMIAFELMKGETYDSSELQELYGLTRTGVFYLMARISAVLPIYQGDDLRWRCMEPPRVNTTLTHT